eukprot:3014891-Pyramimonas_sp.AAC.1
MGPRNAVLGGRNARKRGKREEERRGGEERRTRGPSLQNGDPTPQDGWEKSSSRKDFRASMGPVGPARLGPRGSPERLGGHSRACPFPRHAWPRWPKANAVWRPSDFTR